MGHPRTIRSRPASRYACALLGCLLLSAPARACGDDSPKVRVTVIAILASEDKEKVDHHVKCIAREVRKIHKHLKGFRPGKITCKSVGVNQAESFELVDDQKATITVLNAACKDGRVQLKIAPPTWGEITYTTCCGKFFPILTRYQTADGEWLIVAVRVQPCNKDKEKKKRRGDGRRDR